MSTPHRIRLALIPVGILLLSPAAEALEPVAAIPPKPDWGRFTILVWQYKTDVRKDLDLYRKAGFRGFHIDRGAGKEGIVAFAREHNLPYYNDHAADKGYLHLTDRTGKKRVLRKKGIVVRPHSLADPKTMEIMKGHLRRNLAVTSAGPVLAYAFDDEVSLGSFNSPAEVDGSPHSVAGYRRWLRDRYKTVVELNEVWDTNYTDFESVQPVSFEAVRRKHTRPPFSKWNLARWMDWRSYMDTQFAECLAELTRYANSIDAATPAGFVGGQQPAPYGGYDYSKVCRAVQWIESYDIGGTCEILRSLWRDPRRPYVQTWFSTTDPRRDAWFLWYYLLHGNRGVIAWPDRGGSWFHYKNGGIAPFIEANAETIREVQSDVSRPILEAGARFDADPIAVYYSHPSVQATWAMDVVPHGGTWPNRSSSLDNKCQSAGKNRVAWFKLLEDCGYQYNVVSADQVAAGELMRQKYKVLVACRVAAMSDAEADAIRAFVRAGGTVIADHLTGVLDEHGRGRKGGGALDDLFGIRRDESRGYLDGRHITELNGEKYNRPFLQRLMYDGALRHKGLVVYERGTKAAEGVESAETAGTASVVVRRLTGLGRTVYLNLTPMAYYDMTYRLGDGGNAWRTLIGHQVALAGVHPRAAVYAGGSPARAVEGKPRDRKVPMTEIVYWRKGDRLTVGIVKNPTRQGSISGAGAIHGVAGEPVDATLHFRRPMRDIVDLRTGQRHPDGRNVPLGKWKPWEALLLQATPAD